MYQYKYNLNIEDVKNLFWDMNFFKKRTISRKAVAIILLLPLSIFGTDLIVILLRPDLFNNFDIIANLIMTSIISLAYISLLLVRRIYINFYKDKQHLILEFVINDKNILLQQEDGSNMIDINKENINNIIIRKKSVIIIYNGFARLGIPIKIFKEDLSPVLKLKESIKKK